MTKPKVTLLVDTERSYLSVAHLVRSEQNPEGRVVRIRAPKFKDAQAVMQNLHRGSLLSAEDTKDLGAVVLDTVSTLATSTRRDVIREMPNFTSLDMWTKRSELFPQLRDWGSMTDLMSRLLAGFAAYCEEKNVPFIILCHERMAVDEITGAKKGGPDLNAALVADVKENSDYVWRIWREESPSKLPHGDFPADTHFLKMLTSETKDTKMRLIPEYACKVPIALDNPTLPRAFGYLGPFVPNILTVFGPSGAGKTTFGCSLSDPKNFPEAA